MTGAKIIDARGLPPPQPFELVMNGLDELARGEELLFILDRDPTPLYRVLRQNGYAWQTTRHDDGRVEIRIREGGA